MQWWRVRRVLNALNLSTAAGLLLAGASRARVTPGPRGLLVASGCRLPFPRAAAFTVGDVVLTARPGGYLEERPRLLAHEERHSWQYAACQGLAFLPWYAAAAGWSWLRGGDPFSHNAFERWAGLADGGYPALSARARRSAGPGRRRPGGGETP